MKDCYECKERGGSTERDVLIVLAEIVAMERSHDPGVWYWTVHLKSGGRIVLYDAEGIECRDAWNAWRENQP